MKHKLKDCHFADGAKLNSQKCQNYLYDLKNRILQLLGVTSDNEITDDSLDKVLKAHRDLANQHIQRLTNIT